MQRKKKKKKESNIGQLASKFVCSCLGELNISWTEERAWM
jgi:hypothetical protein